MASINGVIFPAAVVTNSGSSDWKPASPNCLVGAHFAAQAGVLSSWSIRKELPAGRRRKSSSSSSSSPVVFCAVGDVSADSTSYLIGGAVAVALLGTAFPILFSRKDLCPECDGAGFVRKSSKSLRANAARKDQAQIVCLRCNGLGKLGQIDK